MKEQRRIQWYRLSTALRSVKTLRPCKKRTLTKLSERPSLIMMMSSHTEVKKENLEVLYERIIGNLDSEILFFKEQLILRRINLKQKILYLRN